jgi:hypothetical protein
VDGVENNIDVLDAKDLSRIQSLNTDKRAIFSFIVIDNFMFCGLAGKLLQAFSMN